jgi:hypothetical protein
MYANKAFCQGRLVLLSSENKIFIDLGDGKYGQAFHNVIGKGIGWSSYFLNTFKNTLLSALLLPQFQ